MIVTFDTSNITASEVAKWTELYTYMQRNKSVEFNNTGLNISNIMVDILSDLNRTGSVDNEVSIFFNSGHLLSFFPLDQGRAGFMGGQ